MHIYCTRSFVRQASKEGLTDEDCQEAIRKAQQGLIDADLGKGLIKQRIAKGSRGAAKGARAIVFYRRGRIAVFLHAFAKSQKANLTKSELALYQRAAQEFAKLTEQQLEALGAKQGWKELEI
jgi:hypothetical protein